MRAIDASRWTEIQALFNEVVDLDETTRSDRMNVVGQSDPELRESVESLLRGDAEAGARLAGMDDVLSPRGDESSTPMRGAIDPLGLSGRMVSHFRVLEPIAVGGMGVVYRAEDTLLGRAVALKLPLPERWFERDARERFVREGRAAGGLDHPNVCAIHEVGETGDGHLYIAMALYSGETLAARIAREGALSASDALSIARSIARGLAAAHAAGIIHRDVKPANVMLLSDGGVKVLDFGLAKPRDVSLTGPRAMMGTVAYMAPEQIRGAPVDNRADLWALGVVLYEMLTGRRPFDGERDITIAHAILHDEPTRPCELRAELSPAVEAVVHSLLQKDREHRPATAESVDAHLAAAELGRPSDIPLSRVRSRRRTMSARQRLGAGAAALVLLGGAGAMLSTRQPLDRPKEFVVVADFETPPADSQIADVLTDVTRRALSASRSLSAAPDNQILLARQRLGVPAGARITRALARQLALGVGIRSVVSGSLRSFSGGYAVSLHLISAASGQVLATAEAPVTNLRDPFAALDTVTRRLREQAGDDLEAIRAQPPAPALTSTSLEAMMDYVTALRLPPDSVARAVALLREAVALDTSFASAYWRLSFFMPPASPRGEAEHRALLAKAWAHRDGLTEYERLRVEIAYKYSPDGTASDVGRHIERLRQVVDRYPNVGDAMILADLYLGKRDLVEAERMYRLAAALDSTKSNAQVGLINTYLKANRVREARRAVDVLTHTFPGMGSDALDAAVWYAEGRPDRARDIMRRLAGSIDTNQRVFGYIQLSMLELRNGRVSAWDDAMRAKDSLVGMRPSAPGLRSTRLSAAYWVLQDPARGLRMLDSSVAGNPALRFGLDVAEFYAQLGAPDSARALMAARGPSHRSMYVQGTDTLPVYAWIDLAEGRPREAAAKFRASLRFSGGGAPSQISRAAETGLAFERAGLADSAIASYEHYLNAAPTWELDAFKLVWVLEHVASQYEAKGDHRKARAAYGRVAELWKDADPALQPRVTYARARAAALR